MEVESIAECSLGAFCNIFDLHKAIIGLENYLLVFFLVDCLRQVLLYVLHSPGHVHLSFNAFSRMMCFVFSGLVENIEIILKYQN